LLNENHENSKHQKPNIKQIQMTKIQNRRNGRVKSIKLSECFGYAQRRRLRRVLGFRIWILFGIWDLRFGILASFLDKQIIVI